MPAGIDYLLLIFCVVDLWFSNFFASSRERHQPQQHPCPFNKKKDIMGKSTAKKAAATMMKKETATDAPVKPMDEQVTKELLAEHLPPIGLVFIIMVCSSCLWVFAFRDVFATGRNIAGPLDDAMLMFTKSMDFFESAKGWKSSQGGLSAIKPATSDANNMGGFFVRKLGGAAALTVHTQKLLPFLFHPLDARWKMGHFRPMLWTAMVSNVAIAAFYASYMGYFVAAGADGLPKVFMALLSIEALVILGYLFSSRNVKRGAAIAMTDGKTPKSVPSRVVARTVVIVSTAIALIAGRDLFFPGEIIDFIPRDDIYLEWTNAFLHSPPEGTPEAGENGMTAELYVGDKFVSQFMGLHFLILCLYKFVTAFGIRYGSDGSGLIKARMIWKAQTIGIGLVLFLFRLFSSAALSASLDLRWHLMCIAYEAVILGLYGYF